MKKDTERLGMWMQIEGLTAMTLAEKMGFEFSYVWRIVNNKRDMSDAFRWRFGETFGFDQAVKLFAEQRIPEHSNGAKVQG